MLSQDPTKRADLKQFFADNDLYLYTANAFVYGVFKKQVIKEDVYEPDWQTPERREYTKQVASLLAELAPEGINPSIQSAPLGFKPKVTGDDVVETYTAQRHRRRRASGRAEEEDRQDGDARPRAGAALLSRDDRRDHQVFQEVPVLAARRPSAWRRRPGSTKPTPHRRCAKLHRAWSSTSATSRWATRTSRRRCRSWWTTACQIVKLQEAASMHIPDVTQETVDALQAFAKTIYLSQTCQLKDGKQPGSSTSRTRSRTGTRTPAHASGARTSTCRCS